MSQYQILDSYSPPAPPYNTNRTALEPCPCCKVPAFQPCVGNFICRFDVLVEASLTEAENRYIERFYRYNHKPVLQVGVS